jgi:hypothetical protein
MEIVRTPLAPAAVLRTLSRIGRPDLVAAIAARGDRIPDDLRERLAASPDPNVQRALDVSGHVPLQHATWLYRPTPSPASAWAIWGLAVAAIAAVTTATVLIVVDRHTADRVPPAASLPLASGGAATGSTGDVTLSAAATAARVRTFTTRTEVPGDPDTTCRIDAWVDGDLPFLLTGPDGTPRMGSGWARFEGPPGTWTMSWQASPLWAGVSRLGGGGCS